LIDRGQVHGVTQAHGLQECPLPSGLPAALVRRTKGEAQARADLIEKTKAIDKGPTCFTLAQDNAQNYVVLVFEEKVCRKPSEGGELTTFDLIVETDTMVGGNISRGLG